MADPPAAGMPAPPFSLPSTAGEVSLDGLRARGRVVLLFYSEDGTPACSTAVALLRDAHEMITELGGVALAVSADSLESHRAFAERLAGTGAGNEVAGELPFPLASDDALQAASTYGVVDEGDPHRSRRALFVIDRGGTVMLSLPHFQPANLSQVEAVFTALGAEV